MQTNTAAALPPAKRKRRRKETALEHAVPVDTDPKIEKKKQRHWVISHRTPDDTQPVCITLAMLTELAPRASAIECHTLVDEPRGSVYAYVHCTKQIHESIMNSFLKAVNDKYLHVGTLTLHGCKTSSSLLVSTGITPLKWLFHVFNQQRMELQKKYKVEFLTEFTAPPDNDLQVCTNGVAEIKPDSPFWKGAYKDFFYRNDTPPPPKVKKPRKDWTNADLHKHVAKLEDWNRKLALELAETKTAWQDLSTKLKHAQRENKHLRTLAKVPLSAAVLDSMSDDE
jgi:hypothetical protein